MILLVYCHKSQTMDPNSPMEGYFLVIHSKRNLLDGPRQGNRTVVDCGVSDTMLSILSKNYCATVLICQMIVQTMELPK